MGKIYKGQTALTIILTCGADITGATAKIGYKKPSGITGTWDATITDAINGVIQYEIQSANDIDESGRWTFWAEITFAAGTWLPGEAVTKFIYEKGE